MILFILLLKYTWDLCIHRETNIKNLFLSDIFFILTIENENFTSLQRIN